MTRQQHRALDAPRILAYRTLLGLRHHSASEVHVTNEEVLYRVERVRLQDQIRRRRLVYLCTLFLTAPGGTGARTNMTNDSGPFDVAMDVSTINRCVLSASASFSNQSAERTQWGLYDVT